MQYQTFLHLHKAGVSPSSLAFELVDDQCFRFEGQFDLDSQSQGHQFLIPPRPVDDQYTVQFLS